VNSAQKEQFLAAHKDQRFQGNFHVLAHSKLKTICRRIGHPGRSLQEFGFGKIKYLVPIGFNLEHGVLQLEIMPD